MELLSCNEKNKHTDNDLSQKKDLISQKFDLDNPAIKQDLDNAILKGDTIAYVKSYKAYTINGKSKEFLYYAILMAEKNNYKRAYYDISRILALRTDDPLYKKYKFSSSFGTYSFFKSYEMGDDFAKEDVKDFYLDKNKKVPKSSSIYCDQ